MRVLWLSNFRFRETINGGTGTWLEAMGNGLCQRDVELGNVTTGAPDVQRETINGVAQWIMPSSWMFDVKALSSACVDVIDRAIREFRPDILHVWGHEVPWGLYCAKRNLPFPVLLEMQGVKSAMAKYMDGSLTLSEQIRCMGVKEILKPKITMWMSAKRYAAHKATEDRIVTAHKYIDYQSEWARATLGDVRGKKLYKVRMALKPEYLQAPVWQHVPECHSIYTSCGVSPNKGLHVLVRAVAKLKAEFPDVRLFVAGPYKVGIRRSGYEKFVRSEIRRLGLDGCVSFLNSLSAAEQVERMRQSAVVVVPSLVESYSMSLAEAMAVGCPCVVSYAGAMPEVAKPGEEALFFPIADTDMCAYQIRRVFESADLAKKLSACACVSSREKHDLVRAVDRQIEIYDEVLEGFRKC